MSKPIYMLTGLPGTGKSMMLRRMRDAGQLHLIDPLGENQKWTIPQNDVPTIGFDHIGHLQFAEEQISSAWQWCNESGNDLIVCATTVADIKHFVVAEECIEIHLLGAPYAGYVQIVKSGITVEYSAEEFSRLASKSLV